MRGFLLLSGLLFPFSGIALLPVGRVVSGLFQRLPVISGRADGVRVATVEHQDAALIAVHLAELASLVLAPVVDCPVE